MKVEQYFLWIIPFILNRYPYIHEIEYVAKHQIIRNQKITTWYITVHHQEGDIVATTLFTKYNNFLYKWLRPQNEKYFDEMIADIRKVAAEVDNDEPQSNEQVMIRFDRQLFNKP